MNLTPELIGLAVLTLVCVALGVGLVRQQRKLDLLARSQRTLVQQLDGTHRAQLAYAEATEDAMSHLRDGLQTLTTVSANLDMKTYALGLQQGRMGQRMKSQEVARQKAAIPTPPPSPEAVSKPAPPAAESPRKLSAAERELITAVHATRARVA